MCSKKTNLPPKYFKERQNRIIKKSLTGTKKKCSKGDCAQLVKEDAKLADIALNEEKIEIMSVVKLERRACLSGTEKNLVM